MKLHKMLLVLLVFAAGLAAGLGTRASNFASTPQSGAEQPVRPHALEASSPEPPPAGTEDIRNSICPIMGNPVDAASFGIAYNGLFVRFCCPGCDTRFLRDPLTHLKDLQEGGASIPSAALKPEAHPPVVDAENTVSPISGEPVDENAPYVVHRSIRVRLSSEDEIPTFLARADVVLLEMARSIELPADRLPEGAR